MKRKLASAAALVEERQLLRFTKRQLRSRLPRRRRLLICPFLTQFPEAESELAHVEVEVAEEVSCDSSIASISIHKPSQQQYQPEFRYDLRRIASRPYYHSKSVKCDDSVHLSDNSCVDSCPGGNNRELLTSTTSKESHVEGRAEVSKSEISSTSRFKDVVPVHINDNYVGSTIRNNYIAIEIHQISGEEITRFESRFQGDGEISVENKSAYNFDLTCSEQFSDGRFLGDDDDDEDGDEVEDEEENSSSESSVQIVSNLESESSQYSPFTWSNDSGSQFSEKSIGHESSSPCFQLFTLFKQQFCRSTYALNGFVDNYCIPLLGLDNEEDEESYRMMRKRERRQVYLRDYAEEYCNTTDYGDLVIQQRLQMVHWIVEQATNKELQMETMFLGVSLLDRFLSKGYFKSPKTLQIAGIACLTLATRIEENQPYNCVRTQTFYVGKMTYDRCQVVAMEWLVQEVLDFQCFLPTLYNFLWFYIQAARGNNKVEKTAKYLAVLALMGHQQLCYWPSIVAAGLVILAAISANQDESCHLITEIHAREKDKDLPECIKSLEWLVKYL